MATWVAIAAVALVVFLIMRAGEQFRLSFRNGKLLVVRGRLPQTLVNDFADTLRRANVQSATLIARRTAEGLRLTAKGISDWDLQRLRNQLGAHSFSRLSSQPSTSDIAPPGLARWLGITWLAWLLAGPKDLT